MGCLSLSKSITGQACDTLKQAGGVFEELYVGNVDDLSAVTFSTTGATEGEVTAFTFKTGKQLVKFSGRNLKNSATLSSEVGENVTTFTHNVLISLYFRTQVEISAIEEAAKSDKLFLVWRKKNGDIYVSGINYADGADFRSFGLQVSLEGTTGVALNDENATVMTATGMLLNMPMRFNSAGNLADNLSTLDGYLTPAS